MAPAQVVQAVTGTVPAILTVIFAGLVMLIGLCLGESRRAYALEAADRLVDLASVVVGGRPRPHGAPNKSRRGRIPHALS